MQNKVMVWLWVSLLIVRRRVHLTIVGRLSLTTGAVVNAGLLTLITACS